MVQERVRRVAYDKVAPDADFGFKRPSMSYRINDQISIPEDEVKLRAIRAQGAGGQNVNKVSSAIHLRFDVRFLELLLKLPFIVGRT